MKKIAKLVLGWIFLVLGVAGLFLPVLQGILFIFIGLLLLSSSSARVQALLDKLARRYPGQYQRVKSLEERVARFFKRS